MNKCILTGRITKDLELRHTTGERVVCNFTIAVNERASEDVDFIDCEVWGKTAENLVNYQSKGSLIAVIGRLKKKDYEKDGIKKYKSYVIAEEIEFLGAKKQENASKEETTIEVNPYADFGASISIDEEDIPF
jgi:single-strand DNA-binding protein